MEVNEDQDIRFHICRNLKILDRMMDDHCNKDMEDIGLTGRQFDVIQYLAMCKQDRVKQVMIEKDFKLSNPTVSGILNRMEKNGFIRRLPDEEDKRCNYIVLTSKALETRSLARSRGRAMERQFFSGISEEEGRFFYSILKKLCDNIAEMRMEQEKE